MSTLAFPRPTPVVGRLIAINALVQLLRATILTSDRVLGLLEFAPSDVLHQPWTIGTYMFVHAGLLHLLFNMWALYVFGTPVEQRMGGTRFTLYYLYCGAGAAVVSLLLGLVLHENSAIIGASGAVLGVAVAFAMLWPQEELFILPIPIPIRARTLVLALAAWELFWAIWGARDGTAHPAHLGGLLFGYLFFRLQRMSAQRPAAQPRQAERVAVAQSASREPINGAPVRSLPRQGDDPVTAEVDRVLDKISAKGIASLTPEERRFLDEVSRRKQQRGLN